jgi:hypothetical protein
VGSRRKDARAEAEVARPRSIDQARNSAFSASASPGPPDRADAKTGNKIFRSKSRLVDLNSRTTRKSISSPLAAALAPVVPRYHHHRRRAFAGGNPKTKSNVGVVCVDSM